MIDHMFLDKMRLELIIYIYHRVIFLTCIKLQYIIIVHLIYKSELECVI